MAMTNPTLEHAARAVSEIFAASPARPMVDEEWAVFERKIARAVLMAVLPELPRHGDEGYVYYDDLTAILAEGE